MLALTLTACGGASNAVDVCAQSACVTNFSDAVYQNGLLLAGGALDLSSGTATERRLGYFSDIYYDPSRKQWWGLSDRGPGGGVLQYDTRVQRFEVDISATGAVSNFRVVQTVKFMQGTQPFNGFAPNPTNVLGRAFDPEGIVINPKNGNLLVSDEYGPSLYEFDRTGQFLRASTTPSGLIPRNTTTSVANFASDTGNTAGKRTNRGFEGLAISADGAFAYAMLQSAMLNEGGGNGIYNRIVKFDVTTGAAVAQYAYAMDKADQGQGISALVSLGNDKFLVLERNNRGIGPGATLATAAKVVYQIDLAGAVDVSGVTLPATGAFAGAVKKGAKGMDLAANTLPALGNKSPEKWEGVAIGPQLANGNYVVVVGTDNDYSVTQNATGTQFDVYFQFTDADPFATSIQCPIGSTNACFFTASNAPTTLTSAYGLLPGVLAAFTAKITAYVSP
ncbi:MAG: esterase-like activity of phytase family protein [Candidatus Saccharibacteria bacterium]|nr:esterase-like activity of phytase family protein [Rhodoferax sp.]